MNSLLFRLTLLTMGAFAAFRRHDVLSIEALLTTDGVVAYALKVRAQKSAVLSAPLGDARAALRP